MTTLTTCHDGLLCERIAARSATGTDDSHSEVDHTRPQSVVERLALPKIRGGTGPVRVAEHGFEG